VSGLNPLAALAAQNALLQAQVQAIDLGVAVEILQQQLSVGDLLTATVLPSQGGIDLLSIFGTTVNAQLPTGVNPGQSLLLQVTGFEDNQILVQNLGVVDPENPPNTVSVVLPDVAPGAPTQAVVTTILPATQQTPPPATTSPAMTAPATPAPPVPGSVAPPRAVFVAASIAPSPVSRGAAPQEPTAAPTAAPTSASPSSAAPPTTTAQPAASAAPLATEEVAGQVAQLGLEARIAATRAASIDIAELVRPAAPEPGPGPSPAQIAPTVPQPLPGVAVRAPVPAAPPLMTARPQPATPPPVAMSARPLVAPSLEGALLDRLRVPLAPLTVAAAKIAANAGTVLPRALARLETLLAGVATQDGRAATLRTLLNFAGRLDPSNARALPEQLAAFVNNFVAGPESKLAVMIRAFLESEAPVAEEAANPSPATPGAPDDSSAASAQSAARTLADAPGSAPNAPAPGAPAANAPAQATLAAQSAPAAVDPSVAARVAERTVALQYDAKAVISAMLEAPPRGATPELVAALNDTLTAITAMQINVLNAQNVNPNTIAIPLPVFFREQGAPVQMHVSKDAQNGKRIDADNFSIAFILDTKSLGTVAIDVQTAGRMVSINVKTEGAPAASRFRSTLDDLRGRLQQLRYNVANMTAGVAPHRIGAADETPAKPSVETAPEARSSSVLDMRA
jgi:Flagellar hook-length control protein FliK